MTASNQKVGGALHRLYSPTTRIRLCCADVTQAAQELRTRHLSGPTAAHILAEALTAVTILSEDASSTDECVILRAQFDGPLGGLLVEATGAGILRGYTNVKVLNELDGDSGADVATAMGMGADVQVVRSLPNRILDQAQLRIVPPSMQVAAAKYLNQSMQIPSAVEVVVQSDSECTLMARGACAQRMPDSDQEAFIRVLEAFHDGRVREAMSVNPSPRALAAAVGLADLVVTDTRPITFGCRCSRAKVIASLHALSADDRAELLAGPSPHHIVCHLCGEDYAIDNGELPKPAA